jgi:hypothetical protein
VIQIRFRVQDLLDARANLARHHRHEISIAQPVGDAPATQISMISASNERRRCMGSRTIALVVQAPLSKEAEFYVIAPQMDRNRSCRNYRRSRPCISRIVLNVAAIADLGNSATVPNITKAHHT